MIDISSGLFLAALVHYSAQSFLVSYWVVATLIPFLVRANGLRGKKPPKPLPEWLGERVSDLMSRVVLAGVLWWGGFWS